MGTLTIRNLPDETIAAVRMRAARHGRSMEAEARDALNALAADEAASMADIDERVRRVQEQVRAMHGGTIPAGMVDGFLRERREAAERGE